MPQRVLINSFQNYVLHEYTLERFAYKMLNSTLVPNITYIIIMETGVEATHYVLKAIDQEIYQ